MARDAARRTAGAVVGGLSRRRGRPLSKGERRDVRWARCDMTARRSRHSRRRSCRRSPRRSCRRRPSMRRPRRSLTRRAMRRSTRSSMRHGATARASRHRSRRRKGRSPTRCQPWSRRTQRPRTACGDPGRVRARVAAHWLPNRLLPECTPLWPRRSRRARNARASPLLTAIATALATAC